MDRSGLSEEERARAERKAARQAARNAAAAAEAAAAAGEALAAEEEAARLARKAKRAAKREEERLAAEGGAADASSPRVRGGSFATPAKGGERGGAYVSASADKLDLLRDFEREREDHAAPRFKRALQARQAEEEEAEAGAAAATAQAAATSASKVKQRKAREEDEPRASPRMKPSPVEQSTPLKARERGDSQTGSKPVSTAAASGTKPRARPAREDADEDRFKLPAPAAGAAANARSSSSTVAAAPVAAAPTASPSDDDISARVASIISSQQSLDVAGLNRILDRIPKVFFQKENFNPFNHWNDHQEELQEWMGYVEQGVEKIVEAYHKGFNTATSSFSHVLSNFSECQQLVRKLSETLAESKRLLSSRNHNLKEYLFQNRMAGKVQEILEKISYVLHVPRWIDEFVAAKQYVHAVVLLQHTLSMMVSEDLVCVDGLLELREEILVRKHFVQGFLLEELHRIIYAKPADANAHMHFVHPQQAAAAAAKNMASGPSPLYQPHQSQEHALMFNPDGTRVKSVMGSGMAEEGDGIKSPLLHAISASSDGSAAPRPTPSDSKYSPFYQGNTSTGGGLGDARAAASSAAEAASARRAPQANDAVLQALLHDETQEGYLKNPEANPNKFLAMLVESLDHMNALPSVKTAMGKRVRAELVAIVQRETFAVRERAKFTLPRRVLARATESGYLTQGSSLLVELIERIFHVLAHVLRNHVDVVQMIHARLRAKGMLAEGGPGGGGGSGGSGGGGDKFSIEGVWQVMQIVLQTMLSDYLHSNDERKGAGGRGGVPRTAVSAQKKRVQKSQTVDLLSELSFSFEDSSAPSIAKMSRGEKQPNRDYRSKPVVLSDATSAEDLAASELAAAAAAQWIESTPYNITAVYRPVVRFTEHAHALIHAHTPPSSQTHARSLRADSDAHMRPPRGSVGGNGDHDDPDDPHSDGSQLRNFLKLFIEVSFLPRVEADVNIRLDEILNDPSAFDAREVSRGGDQARLQSFRSSHSGNHDPAQGLQSFPGAEVEHNLLAKCVLELGEILRKNFSDMFMLPHSVPHFLAIVEHSVERLLHKANEKFHNDFVRGHIQGRAAGLIGGGGVLASAGRNGVGHGGLGYGGAVVTPLQLLLQADEKVLTMLEDDPLLLVLRVGEREASIQIGDIEEELVAFYSPANPMYAPLFQRGARIDRNVLNFDTRVWAGLGLMAESFEWLADRLFHLNVFSPEVSKLFREEQMQAQQRGVRMHRMGSKHSSRQHGPHLEPFRKLQALERKRHGSSLPSVLSRRSLLDQKRYSLAASCLALADRCFFTLRLELHAHLFFFLSEMQSGSYWCTGHELGEPEQFVLELNRDLVLIDESLGKFLSLARRRYVFGGTAELMAAILVRNLALLQDKRVNARGVAKIVRNCFALQQNLTNIEGASSAIGNSGIAHALGGGGDGTLAGGGGGAGGGAGVSASPMQEGHFDRARQYYELLNCTQEELLLFQLENPDMFSADEYAALLSVQTQARAGDAGRAYA